MATKSMFASMGLKLVAALCFMLLAMKITLDDGAIEVNTVAGPNIPGTYKHAASACELSDNRILLVYYSGSGEYGRDTAIFATTLDRETRMWSRLRIIADEPDKAEGNPALWRSPDGRLWLFYPIRHAKTWATATLAAKVSENEGVSWTDAEPPSERRGLMTRARPITLADGACLLPVDWNRSTDPEFISAESGSLFLRSGPDLEAWEETHLIHSRLGNLQPAVAAIGEGRLAAYCRRGGDYFGRADGWLVRTESADGGRTWSRGEETRFPNPNSPVDFVRLQSGNLLLAFNDSAYERSPLSVALSTDGDRTYGEPRVIMQGAQAYSYPCVLQTSDGMIHVFFTAGSRSHIKHAQFREEEVGS